MLDAVRGWDYSVMTWNVLAGMTVWSLWGTMANFCDVRSVLSMPAESTSVGIWIA